MLLLLLLRLLTPVTGFSFFLGGSSSVSEEDGFNGGGFVSKAGFFFSWAVKSPFRPKAAEEVEGFVENALRFRQTNIGAEAVCFDKSESGFGFVDDDGFGGRESGFLGWGSDRGGGMWWMTSAETRWPNCCAVRDSAESLGKKAAALVKRRRRSRKKA